MHFRRAKRKIIELHISVTSLGPRSQSLDGTYFHGTAKTESGDTINFSGYFEQPIQVGQRLAVKGFFLSTGKGGRFFKIPRGKDIEWHERTTRERE